MKVNTEQSTKECKIPKESPKEVVTNHDVRKVEIARNGNENTCHKITDDSVYEKRTEIEQSSVSEKVSLHGMM